MAMEELEIAQIGYAGQDAFTYLSLRYNYSKFANKMEIQLWL